MSRESHSSQISHDQVRGIVGCDANQSWRNQLYCESVKLNEADIAGLFAYQNPRFESNLYPEPEGDGSHLCIAVILKDDFDRAKKKSCEIARPRIPWHYDLSLRVNLALIVRWQEPVSLHRAEINWIALNMVDFNCIPTWEYFDRIVNSLLLFNDCLKDIVSNDSPNWSSEQRQAVHVCVSIHPF